MRNAARRMRMGSRITAQVLTVTIIAVCSGAITSHAARLDWRNITNGFPLPSEGYADQPYIVVTHQGHWLCVMTTGQAAEGSLGQHVVSTISTNQGRTWSPLVDIEPAGGPEASWAAPLITPGGRVYVFYDFNGENVRELRGRRVRTDMLGWYVFKYSDDGGRSWSSERQRLPVRVTDCDRSNDWQGRVQILWGIDKPKTFDGAVLFGFTKLGKYMLDLGEGWFFRSDNILVEPDVRKLRWELQPAGEHGLRAPEFGSIQEEFNTVPLGGDRWYCIYRTTNGFPCHAYSNDGGRTWTRPEPATYKPGGRLIKNPRACPKLFRCANGNYLLWFHNHSGKTFEDRNPAWISGGVLREGRLHWSQPEILLYADDPKVRMSYPDLVEQDGQFWISETQKSVARVHHIDPALLEGVWMQDINNQIARRGLVMEMTSPTAGTNVEMPHLSAQAGFTLDCRVQFDDLGPGQELLDSRSTSGNGLVLRTTTRDTVEVSLSDGRQSLTWDCDTGLLNTNQVHHLGIVVDPGPRLVTFLVDGQVCDGAKERQFGWTRFPSELGDMRGNALLRLAPELHGRLLSLRIYDRPLRNSELISHYRAALATGSPRPR